MHTPGLREAGKVASFRLSFVEIQKVNPTKQTSGLISMKSQAVKYEHIEH